MTRAAPATGIAKAAKGAAVAAPTAPAARVRMPVIAHPPEFPSDRLTRSCISSVDLLGMVARWKRRTTKRSDFCGCQSCDLVV
jgi:hypothetical protein